MRPAPVVRGVRITHPDRVMYDRPRLTKLDVALYYDAIAEAMMPHVDGRPLTLVRIREKTKIGDYLVIESADAIVSLAQMDVIEIHTWNTRRQKVERPDRVILDLDPGPRIAWPAVVESARLVRRLLRSIGLESFVKTTGGRGLHVVVPLEPRDDWQTCLTFARAVADALVQHDPRLFTTRFSKLGRERRILVDYLRNNRTNTSIAAFSMRAREGAPVSVPLSWTELTPSLDPLSVTLETCRPG